MRSGRQPPSICLRTWREDGTRVGQDECRNRALTATTATKSFRRSRRAVELNPEHITLETGDHEFLRVEAAILAPFAAG